MIGSIAAPAAKERQTVQVGQAAGGDYRHSTPGAVLLLHSELCNQVRKGDVLRNLHDSSGDQFSRERRQCILTSGDGVGERRWERNRWREREGESGARYACGAEPAEQTTARGSRTGRAGLP